VRRLDKPTRSISCFPSGLHHEFDLFRLELSGGSKESSVFPGHLLENSAHVVVESLEEVVDELLA
jgi:hypothetical protein